MPDLYIVRYTVDGSLWNSSTTGIAEDRSDDGAIVRVNDDEMTVQLSRSHDGALLRIHKRSQNELKMKNRTTYCDFGLVFAKAHGDVTNRATLIGQPLQANNLGERSFLKLVKAANVRPIVFHGLRHTCATLMLRTGEPVHVVAQRLGHSDASITMRVYAHVLPDMQQSAAAKLGALLLG